MLRKRRRFKLIDQAGFAAGEYGVKFMEPALERMLEVATVPAGWLDGLVECADLSALFPGPG
jgi:hypothetical protein